MEKMIHTSKKKRNKILNHHSPSTVYLKQNKKGGLNLLNKKNPKLN